MDELSAVFDDDLSGFVAGGRSADGEGGTALDHVLVEGEDLSDGLVGGMFKFFGKDEKGYVLLG